MIQMFLIEWSFYSHKLSRQFVLRGENNVGIMWVYSLCFLYIIVMKRG